MFTTWLFHNLTLEYNSFQMMLNNNQKAQQAKKQKTKPDFDFILEQILNLNIQKKTSEVQSMKLASKPRKKKKSNTEPLSLCPYYFKPGHSEEKCYYKHSESASKDFWQKFPNCIKKSFNPRPTLPKLRTIILRKKKVRQTVYTLCKLKVQF